MAHNYKLKWNEVLNIKEQLANTNKTMVDIAHEFHVSLSTIQAINRGETHSDVGSFSHPIRKRQRIHQNRIQNQAKKINDEQAIDIFIRLETGESPWRLSKEYGVSMETIQKIVKRPMFRHVLMFD